MALKRSDLNKILNAFKSEDETLEGSTKALLDLFHSEIDTEKDKYDDLKAEYDKYKSEHPDTEENAEEWKTKYERERDEFEKYKTEQEAKADKATKSEKYKALLKEAGVSEKRLDTILRVTDLDSIKLKDGELVDSDKLTETIKNDWADFISKKETKGADTPNPSGNVGGNEYTSKADIMKITDRAARRQAIKENPQFFINQE